MSLTAQQERFCQEVANGKTQSESMLLAYPQRKKWQKKTVNETASVLAKKHNINTRIKELKKPTQDLLEANRTEIIQKIIDIGLKDTEVKQTTLTALTNLLNKLVATKSESKIEANIRTIEDVINELG